MWGRGRVSEQAAQGEHALVVAGQKRSPLLFGIRVTHARSVDCELGMAEMGQTTASPERSLSSISHAWSRVWKAECRMRNGSVHDRMRFWTSPAL